MTFFCAKCQKRHDVHEISADLWSICKRKDDQGNSQLRENVKTRFMELINTRGGGTEKAELMSLYNNVLAFLNSPEPAIGEVSGWHREARINAFFALNKNTYRTALNTNAEGDVVSGTYKIRLGILLNLYSRWDLADYVSAISLIPKEWYNEVIHEQEMKVYFGDNGVLDKVTDLENVPFPEGDEMHGFTHICPHCGHELSRAAGAAEEIVVALAGAPRAGKTACMVAMLSSILKNNCPGIRIVPMAHDHKWDNLRGEIDFYDQGKKVEKTPDKLTEVPAHSILIQLNDRAKTQRVLTIVDMPGEFWQGTTGLTPEFFREYAGIYENIDCIWFVISKATVCLSHTSNIPNYVVEDLSKIVSEEADIIRKSAPQNLSINLGMLDSQLQKPMPPIIVIVSKADYSITEVDEERTRTYKLFPEDLMEVASENASDLNTALKTDSHRLHGLGQYPLYEHSNNVRSFIEDTCPPFLTAIEENCPDHFYTAVSPYGHPALDRDADYTEEPNPYHELFPFIWTLAIKGGLQIFQGCKWIKKNFLNMVVSEEHSKELVTFRYTNRNMPVPKGKDKQRIEDLNQVYKAISNNMLMNGHNYISEVVINHEKQ